MPRFIEILTAAAAGVVLLAGIAHADSRLFSARSDENGVSVTGATLNGQELAVAGQGGGVTFFRINNPGGPVSCTNHIAFTGSNGKVATIDADICANGTQVTVPFSTASVPPPAPPAAATPPAAPAPAADGNQPAAAAQPAGIQPVTISVSDPAVTIDSVFLAGKPVAINRRIGDAVEVLVAPGPNGITCSRDLGLVLSDGRRIARAVDICANDWKVNVALAAAGGTTTTPAPPPPPPPTAATAGAPASVSPNAAWMFTSTNNNGSLAFAVPNSDNSEFTAVCSPGAGAATIALGRSAPEVQPGRTVTVAFSDGTFAQSYPATGSDVSPQSGLSNPLITLKTDDPLWQAIIQGSYLTIRIGSAAPYTLSLKGSAAQARPFLNFCTPASQVAPAPPVTGGTPIPSPDSGTIPFACDDGTFINVLFDDANGRVIVNDGGGPRIVLRRVPSNRGARYVGRGGDVLVGLAETITWSRGGSYPATCRPR